MEATPNSSMGRSIYAKDILVKALQLLPEEVLDEKPNAQ